MSDTGDPRPPAPPEEPRHESAAEHLRDLAHEIQHEIEDVVEHVPAPVRWTVRRIVLLVLLSLAAVLVIGIGSVILWLANRTEWVAQEIAVVVNQTLASRSDVLLQMDDVRGNPLTGLRVVRPRVRFRTGGGAPLLEARSLTLRYGAWSVLTGGARPIAIELEEPVIRLTRAADGRWRLPRWESRPARAGKSSERGFELAIHGGRIELPEPYGRIEKLELDAGVTAGAATRVDIRRLTWASGPWGSRLDRLEASLDAGDSVTLRLHRLETGDVALGATARWKAGVERPEHLVHLDVQRVRWAWLAKVFDNGALDVPGEGRVRGDLSDAGGWHGGFDADLTWDGLAAKGTGRVQERRPGGWTVDRLDFDSPAGAFRGTFVYDRAGWSVSGNVANGNPAEWSALKLPGWPEGELAGRFVYSVETTRKFSRLDARLGPSVLAGWRADSARVRVEAPGAGRTAFEVRMLRRGGVMRLSAATDDEGWAGRYEVEDFPLDEWPDGRASGIRGTLTRGAGTVANRKDGLYVTGDLRGARSEWLGARMDAWRVETVNGRLLPAPDLTANVALADVMFLGLHFDSTGFGLGLGDGTAALADVRARAGDTLVTLAGTTRFGEGGWSASFDRAAMTSSGFAWTAEPRVELAGDARGVTFQRLVARDGEARMTITGRWAAPGGSYDWTGVGERVDLARLGLPDSLALTGRADARLRVTGVSGDPRFRFETAVRLPGIGGHDADTLSLVLHGRPHALDLERFGFGIGRGTLEGRGSLDGMTAAWPDTLTPDRVMAWIRTASRWQAEGRARDLPIEGAGNLNPAAMGWKGRLGGTLRLNGNPGRPAFDAELVAAPFSYGATVMDRAYLRADYHDQALEVREFTLTTGNVRSLLSGRMPLVLAMGEKPELPDRPMHWEAEVPRGDLAILPVLLPQIGSASGSFALRATLDGTPRRPDLDGTLRIEDGVVRLAAREEVLEKVNARFRLDESRITLDTLTAVQGERGRVSGSGVVELDGLALRRYDFGLRLQRFTASETDVYAAEVSGDLRVVNGPRVRGVSLPQVTGAVDVLRAAVQYDFTRQTESDLLAASTQPLFWTYRVDVTADDNLRWTPPDADIEFNADVTLEQTRDSLLVYGEMHALRGSYFFTGTRFNVTRADLTFDNVGGVNPVLDAEATTTVTGSCVLAGRDDLADVEEAPHTITVQIAGRANEPVVTFASDPDDWDEPCILRQITLGGALAGGLDVGGVGSSYLARAISRSLSPELEKTFGGYLNDWTIERSQAGALIVGTNAQPVRNVNLRYQQRVTGGTSPASSGIEDPFQQSVQAEYRLGRFLYIATQLIRRGPTSTSTTPNNSPNDFNVKLKARWEY